MTTNDEAAAITGACLERTAAQRDAFAHPCETVSRPVGRRLRVAVVRDLELELVLAPPQRHPRLRRACVLERVRERLLDEPVGGEVDARRQLPRLALDVELDLEARLTHGSDQDVERPQ